MPVEVSHIVKEEYPDVPEDIPNKPEDWSELEKFIHLVQEGQTEEDEFIYLNIIEAADPYNLEVVQARGLQRERYFTMSAKGVSLFVNGSPQEFTPLADWLVEREAYYRIREINFFKKFRIWKSYTSWKDKVLRTRRNKMTERLSEKLFVTDSTYATMLLTHRSLCCEMEKWKFVEVLGHMEGYSLEKFLVSQDKRRQEVSEKLQENERRLRDNINENIRTIMDKLREYIVNDIAKEEEHKRLSGGQQQTYQVKRRKTSALYEKMGFPENMNYGQRAILRKACSRFLRFSFLSDFIVLDSLRIIYLGSVEEIVKALDDLNFPERALEEGSKRPPKTPLFALVIEFMETEIPAKFISEEEVVPFKLKPKGPNEPEEYDPNNHAEIEEAATADSPSKLNRSDEIDDTKTRQVVSSLNKVWLTLEPKQLDFFRSILDLVFQGLDCLTVIERWSRHPELLDYADTLEEWDYMVAETWEAPASLFLDPRPWLADHPSYAEIEPVFDKIFQLSFDRCSELMMKFDYYLATYWKNSLIDFDRLRHPRLKEPIEVFTRMYRMFEVQAEKFENIPKVTDTGLIRIDSQGVRTLLQQSPKNNLDHMRKMLPDLFSERIDRSKHWATDSIRALSMRVASVEDYVEQKYALTEVNAAVNDEKNHLDNYALLNRLMYDLSIPISKELQDSYSELVVQFSNLTSTIIFVEGSTEKNMQHFRKDLNSQIPEFLEEVSALELKAMEPKYLRIESGMAGVLIDFRTYSAKATEFEERARKINQYQDALELAPTNFEQVEVVKEQVELRHNLWQSLSTWRELKYQWVRTPFAEIEDKKISDKADEFAKVVTRSENSLPESSVTAELRREVFAFRETMPVVIAMRSPLEPNHWDIIRQTLNKEFEITPEFTLGDLMELNVVEHTEAIQAVATQAAQEAALKEQLSSVKDVWEELELPVKNYRDHKDIYILGDLEDLRTALDESCSKVSTIVGNRYMSVIREEVTEWKEKLNLMQDILEEWATFQKNWMYLENIFAAKDIKRQIAYEAQMFDSVDKFFKNLMKKTNVNSNALKATSGVPGLLETFKKHNATLDTVQKLLSQYLETKRRIFARLYFISDDELIMILAKGTDPLAVLPFLKNCFENIYSLEFASDGRSINSIVSGEGEVVALAGKQIVARNNVEDWLSQLEGSMVENIIRLMKEGREDYEGKPRKDWVQAHHGQIVSTVSLIMWTYETENALRAAADNPEVIEEWHTTVVDQLSKLTELVRGNLTDIKRKIIVALITSDVHGRDIIEMLLKNEVESPNDFMWQQQLRYYWDDETDLCSVRQVNAVLSYGYEYMGATTRLVITPLTDRCWITITGALNIKLGASPAGPAGTGKTESTKDLAKGLGVQCVVFNCSEQITFIMMAKLFSGLCQQGCWTCLDEFNRIDIEVLSVIAQQLQHIRKALLQNLTEFNFEGQVIPLKPTVGVFVTMNPNYAGRNELPDNLKVCFRPVSMMIPDYAMIAEIMLYAEGFSSAKVLSKKMVQLYKLASEQLSQQDHYDFGMRAVKSVLVMAGELKRSEASSGSSDNQEKVVLIRAMRDSNIPKFLAKDLPLFNALIQDLFPGIEIPSTDFGTLLSQVEDSLETLQKQVVPDFVTKVIQLFDTFCVRFGVMLVGPTGGGKTQCYKTLAHAMTQLREDGHSNKQYQKVHLNYLNPKCITMGELYGEVNPLTQDWKDGLASSIMRSCAAETSQERSWVVFDGPVDALWIENMNTVLDDNMMLCLANGQRIKLRAQMRILFEVQDLAVASPATVSRCGMVYVPAEILGWKPFVYSWVQSTFSDNSLLDDELQAELLRLFDSSMDAIFKLKKTLQEQIATVEVQSAKNICNFLDVLIHPDSGFRPQDKPDKKAKFLSSAFVFAFVWGVGGALKTQCRDKFSDIVRHLFGSKVSIPIAESVFEYCLDIKKSVATFRHWNELVPTFTLDKSVSYFSIIVPTIDTVRYDFILSTLYRGNKAVYFTGDTGVGKSIIINAMMAKAKEAGEIEPVQLNFSAQTTSERTQVTIESKLERKSTGYYEAVGAKKLVIFVDDANMPSTELFGAQPPIELLRLFVENRGFYDRHKLFWKEIGNSMLICAAAPPGGGRSALTPRFMRHFNLFNLPEPSSGILQRIFGSILQGFFDVGFAENVKTSCIPVVKATIEVFERITQSLKPTPMRFHYLFNLRDVSKVFQGILQCSPFSVANQEQLGRLWAHEVSRVFQDRLINAEDKQWFSQLLTELLVRAMRLQVDHAEWFEESTIMFTDLMNLTRANVTYEEVTNRKKLVTFLANKLDECNASSANKMQLVFFEDAILHTLRISRVLRQPRGNLMLIGVGGSGKQSLTRLASSILEYKVYQIELTRSYGLTEFREDLKKMMMITGLRGEPLTFILTDTQIAKESFLEDINSVLNTGEVTNLFQSDEIDALIDELRPEVVDRLKLPDSRDVIYTTFVQRVRNLLHVVLCMSPVGNTLRVRCRMFPSLVNCSTLDWFSKWPEEALMSVAEQYMKEVSVPEAQKASLASMCVLIHTSVQDKAELFYAELRRRMYNTPKSYLDLISLFLKQLETKKSLSFKSRDRLSIGLTKLFETRKIVRELQEKLTEMAPKLAEEKQKGEEYFAKVTEETASAEQVKEVVEKETAIVNHRAMEVRAKADEAQRELDEAEPVLLRANAALDEIDKSAIATMKTFTAPPNAVRLVMEAVCLLLGEKPDWASAKAVLGQMNFISRMKEFKRDTIPEAVVRKLKTIVTRPDFDPEFVGSKASAAKPLCNWCIAVSKYVEVLEVVTPKKNKAAQMKTKLEADMVKLKEKQDELNEVNQRVEGLQRECAETEANIQQLEESIGRTELRLGRAEQLIDLLAEEGVRWEADLKALKEYIEKIVGDVFLSAASISYLGPFTGKYRRELTEQWTLKCIELALPCSSDYSLQRVMGTPVTIRQWNIAGLPTDTVSVENAILATCSQRWPLMIDPQSQAVRWIKALEKANNLRTLKLPKTDETEKPEEKLQKSKELSRAVEACLINGIPILFEDVGEQLEPSIDPIMSKQFYKSTDGRWLIRLGDADINYDPTFRLYLTTKLPNPHFLPEVCIKVNVINFTVTFPGLEEQLLADVVRQEKPLVESQKNELIVSMARDRDLLESTQIKILKLIAESSENILDDVVLIETMQTSKKTSSDIKARMLTATEIERTINETRELYRAIAERGAVLYFVVADLAGIDPMYQNSLDYIKLLFNSTIESSAKSSELKVRLQTLTTNITKTIYTNICRGLFETHKNIYSFLIASAIQRKDGNISEVAWSLLVRGPAVIEKSKLANPFLDVFSAIGWDIITQVDKLHGLTGIAAQIAENRAAWTEFFASEDILRTPLPGEWESRFDAFNRLLVYKAACPEKLMFALTQYVRTTMGAFYTESPPVTLEKLHADSNSRMPIIFVLSQGADPTNSLMKFAREAGMGDRIENISLGQGQGPKAQHYLEKAKHSGDWLLLNNCHLAKSWMPTLEKLVENLREEAECVDSFRLFLTSMPEPYFPVSVLQNGLKMTTEAPRGIRSNLKRSYGEISEDQLNESTRPESWKKLLFSLSFFHAVIQERRKFGPLGFNIRYDFNDSDLETSVTMLRIFLEEQEELPWEAMLYVTGEINYGGRVTDDWDRVCLMSILRKFYSPDALEEGYQFSESGTYYIPTDGDLSHYRAYIEELPQDDLPEVFGLHSNANITYQAQETDKIISTVLSIQPRVGGSATVSSDDIVMELARSIFAGLPELLDPSSGHPDLFVKVEYNLIPSLSTVLLQECERFNVLLTVMARTLTELQQAIKGEVLMSNDLDQMYLAMLNSQVPSNWKKVSYPSLKPLGSWIKDLAERVEFMANWISYGNPPCYWLSGFFFPQGFMTGTLQTYSRRYQHPIDQLKFRFSVLDYDKRDVTKAAYDGVYVYGLFLEGARWDRDEKFLADQQPGELYSRMPVIHFLPSENYETASHDYPCPVYKTSVRAGALSTTGQSTNFILAVDLSTEEEREYWTLRGCALLCQLND
jgi:dynein heavy chain